MCSVEFVQITPRVFSRGRVFIRTRNSKQGMRVGFVVAKQASTFAAQHVVLQRHGTPEAPLGFNYSFFPLKL